MSMQQKCPICGDGVLQQTIETEEVIYKGSTLKAPLYFSVCDCCGCEQASAEQIRENKRALIAAKKEFDGLLSSDEIRTIREYLKLTQADAGNIFGGGPTAFSKYESNDVSQSKSMDTLIRLAYEIPEVANRLMPARHKFRIHALDAASLTSHIQSAFAGISSSSNKHWTNFNRFENPEKTIYEKIAITAYIGSFQPDNHFSTFHLFKDTHTDYTVSGTENFSSGHDLYVRSENTELH